MSVVLAVLISLACFVVAYAFYSRFLGRRILALDPARRTPAHELEDGVDYVPTRKVILFGHHFASIAGLAPIVGPAIAVIWGWLPALIWVVVGTVFLGAVHDFSALVVSLRHRGRSIGDITAQIIGPRARLLFLVIVFFLLALAMGIFASYVAHLFTNVQPEAVIPVFSLIAIAVIFGLCLRRLKVNLAWSSLIAFAAALATVGLGVRVPIPIYPRLLSRADRSAIEKLMPAEERTTPKAAAAFCDAVAKSAAVREGGAAAVLARGAEQMRDHVTAAGDRARRLWIYTLLIYALIASVLPVWLLLQPRDYLNSYQLYLGAGLLLISVLAMGFSFKFAAPAMRGAPGAGVGGTLAELGRAMFATTRIGAATLPALFPLLFVTVACGAVSGFHCLVSSGTTAKQLDNEQDARLIGYGGMLTESVVSVLVVAACAAGVAYVGAKGADVTRVWAERYSDLSVAKGGALAAFIDGGGFLLQRLWIPFKYGTTLVAVVIVGFAMTTLDTGARLLRYNVEELATSLKLKPLSNRFVASLIAVGAIGFFALYEGEAKAHLWQLFGGINQLLAALALLVVSVYLHQRRKPVIYTVVPLVFMAAVCISAMSMEIRSLGEKQAWVGVIVAAAVLMMAVWLAIEGMVVMYRSQRERKAEKNRPLNRSAS